MSAIHETAYPQLKPDLSLEELQKNFTPTSKEMLLMEQCTQARAPVNRLGFMLTLKCYQCLGYAISLKKLSDNIKVYVSGIIGVDSSFDITDYATSKGRKRHLKAIRAFLDISNDRIRTRQCMKNAALRAASFKENIADIVNDMLEELVKSRFEIPAYSSLLRMARASRMVINNQFYRQITGILDQSSQDFIDSLFDIKLAPEKMTTGWSFLKQEMKSPTYQHVKDFIGYYQKLNKWKRNIKINLDDIPVYRVEQFFSEAMALDAADMSAIRPERRYALAAVLLHYRVSSAIDDIVTILIRWTNKMQHSAEELLDEHIINRAGHTDDLISLLHKILLASLPGKSRIQRLKEIESCIPENCDTVIEECEKHLAYAGDNHLPFLLSLYKSKRHVLFKILEVLDVQSATQDKTLERAIEFIWVNYNGRKKKIKIEESHLDLINWLSEKWYKCTVSKIKSEGVFIDKKYYELAVFKLLADDLNSGDAYAKGANSFDDPNKQFISLEEFNEGVPAYCQLVNLPSGKAEFISFLQEKHREAAKLADERFLSNEYLSIEKGEPVLKKAARIVDNPAVKKMSQEIADRMPQTNIVEVILDVEQWVGLSQNFRPLSGHESKIEDYNLRFVSTSFSYGCNVGPVQTERCLQKYSRKQIAWIFNHHITEHRLNKGIEKLINMYSLFELPKIWGTGKSVSGDGTYWNMYTNNLLAEHHIRYGQYGGIGYYHVSDQYIALFSNFIPCGVYEAAYIFDGLLENKSDIQPTIIHGDTGIQNEVVFGFAFLLAIQLMPRIRNFKHLKYYRPSKQDHYLHIDALFTSDQIDWELIETHYHDMLRVVMSIQGGKMKPSTLLRKLCAKSRKNKLYFAFRELGRVIRTIFLLQYLNNVELRRTIQAATCKSEEFNGFLDWVTFGGNATIKDNDRNNQKKIIKYMHLVANMVSLHVMANMTTVVNEMRNEGIKITDEILNKQSPFRTDHINRLGVFSLSGTNKYMPLEYGLTKIRP